MEKSVEISSVNVIPVLGKRREDAKEKLYEYPRSFVQLEVRKVPGFGKGVFTLHKIKKGALVDISHVIPFTEEEFKKIEHTILGHYVYEWPEDRKGAALACGYGSLFNHSKNPNLTHVFDFEQLLIKYSALRDISSGEELKISYGTELWFEDKE